MPDAVIRDKRLTGAKKVRAVGHREAAAEGRREQKRAADENKRVEALSRKGVPGFGTIKDLHFRRAVAQRLNEEMPAILDDFKVTPGSKEYTGPGSPVFIAIMQYVSGCFIAYEEEIHRLNGVIRKLKRERKKLEEGGAEAAVVKHTGGKDTTAVGWKERTLRRHALSIQLAVEKESGGCPVKAITLAREVLRRLGDEQSKTAKGHAVNDAIVASLRKFYAEIRSRHKGNCSSSFCTRLAMYAEAATLTEVPSP